MEIGSCSFFNLGLQQQKMCVHVGLRTSINLENLLHVGQDGLDIRHEDIECHLRRGCGAFCANKSILCDWQVLATRLNFFGAMVTSAVCFAAGHRKVHTSDAGFRFHFRL